MPSHTYKEFEGTLVWREIEAAIDDLVENRDLTVSTAEEYVIGYHCKLLKDKGLLAPSAFRDSDSKEKSPINLRGSWKGKFPDELDVEAEIREIRDEWKKKFDQ